MKKKKRKLPAKKATKRLVKKKAVKAAKKKCAKTAPKKSIKRPTKRAAGNQRIAKAVRKKMSKKDRDYYRDKLLKLRVSITENMNHFQKTALYHSQRDASGDLSGYGIHQADAATDAYEIDFSLGLATSSQEILHEIDEALARIKDGSYGFSELSGKLIGKKRLGAVPYARFTKEEQEQFERKRKAGF